MKLASCHHSGGWNCDVAADFRKVGSNPGKRPEIFLISQTSRLSVGPTQPPVQWDTGVPPPPRI